MRKKSGFTLVEILVVLGLVAIIFGLGARSFSAMEKEDRLSHWSEEATSILIYARLQAQNGATLGENDSLPFGVHFNENEFIFFPGSSYQPGNSKNIVHSLPNSLHFQTIDLPAGGNIIFQKITGAVSNFDPLHHQVVLKEKNSNRLRTISINKLGVVETTD